MCAAAKATSYEACALLVAAEAAEAEVRSARELASSAMKARGERARDREEIARVARQLATMDAQVSAF
jgi:mannose/cellobiose epimerase-like protein (N-acyl-D-glucosamine 2-epimerase family)